VGRTHLQDAVPLSLGPEFSGLRGQAGARPGEGRSSCSLPQAAGAGIGGRRWAPGLNAPAGFGEAWTRSAERQRLGSLLAVLRTNSRALAGHERWPSPTAPFHGAGRLAPEVSQRHPLAGQRPRCARRNCVAGERTGSSIMPGKVNPTQCEKPHPWLAILQGLGQQDTACNSRQPGKTSTQRFSSPCWPTTCWRSCALLSAGPATASPLSALRGLWPTPPASRRFLIKKP